MPVEGAERDEIVVFTGSIFTGSKLTGSKPWQTVPAMNVSGVALAQRAIGIVNTCLRK